MLKMSNVFSLLMWHIMLQPLCFLPVPTFICMSQSIHTQIFHGGPEGQTAPPQGCWCSAGWLRVSGRTGEHPATSASAPTGRSERPAHKPDVSPLIYVTKTVSPTNSEVLILHVAAVKVCRMNLVAVAQVAVALPVLGTGSAEAGGGLRSRGLGAQRRVLVLAADELRLRRGALLHLPQTRRGAGCHHNTATADIC